jgi:hypothetical protein
MEEKLENLSHLFRQRKKERRSDPVLSRFFYTVPLRITQPDIMFNFQIQHNIATALNYLHWVLWKQPYKVLNGDIGGKNYQKHLSFALK